MRSLSFFFGLYLYKELLELLHGRRQPMRSRSVDDTITIKASITRVC